MRRRSSLPAIPTWRRRALLLGWLAFGAIIVARSVQIQVVQADVWREAAVGQQNDDADVQAPRGAILDRSGEPLAVSRELYRVNIAGERLQDREAVRDLLVAELGISQRRAERATTGTGWTVIPGTYEPSVRETLGSVPGVVLERLLTRFYPHGDLARPVLGRVLEEEGRGGIEQHYDEQLRGQPGHRVAVKDPQGRPIPGKLLEVVPPVPGGEVRTTLDLSLQEIAHEALSEALGSTEAAGGDLIISDPHTGEILALVSIGEDGAGGLSAINSPYEPGSTLKPFTVAKLLDEGAGSLQDVVDTEGGRWRVAGTTLTDITDNGVLTLAEALRVSSNIGVAKAASALTHDQQYEGLRDFGFGVPTGLRLPGESGGLLRKPSAWSGRSSASLAIGYEISVTPIQMVMAYGALANGGYLLEPRIVKEVRGPDGSTVETPKRTTVRRVVPADVTEAIRNVLVDVVEEGTGTAARLTSFEVAGKSGTARAYVPGSGYEAGRHFASFVGFFPADDPQLVIFVKLDQPQGAYYGGQTAAPVTRQTLEAVLAARQSPIDRRSLLKNDRETLPQRPAIRFAGFDLDPAGENRDAPRTERPAPGERVSVPDVAGLPARVAARRLHDLGFRVVWEGSGSVAATSPPIGTRWLAGDTVRLRSGDRTP